MKTLYAAISGNYTPVGELVNADCIIGQSFGTETAQGPGQVNELLAKYICDLEVEPPLPLLLQHEIATALESIPNAPRPSHIIKGQASTSLGSKLDSWEVLQEAKAYMDEHNLQRPLLVAQAFHVGRVTLQAKKQGMEPIVPPNLPKAFDPRSQQWWTKGPKRWTPRELAGMPYLKWKKKL